MSLLRLTLFFLFILIASLNNTIYLFMELPESNDLFGSSHWAVINDGRLLSTATLHVTIHGVVAHVQLPANIPDRDER